MPPASFVGGSACTCSDPLAAVLGTLPSSTRPGDSIVVIVGTPTANPGPELGDWTQTAIVQADGSLWVIRREAGADELGNVSIPFPGGFPDGGTAILLVYRNLDTGAAPVASSSATVAGSVSFPAPSITLAKYSDLAIAIALVSTAAVVVTGPAGMTSRASSLASGLAIAAFDLLPEAAGAIGVKTSTVAAIQSGVAAAIALAAKPVPGFGLSFSFDPAGAIGLPSKGV